MICPACARQQHRNCIDLRCPCQHKTPPPRGDDAASKPSPAQQEAGHA